MKLFRLFSLTCLFSLALWSCKEEKTDPPVEATGNVKLEGNIRENMTLSASKKYILLDKVYVKSGATLTIEAGTVIFGDKSTAGTLIIEPGAKIIAEGTAQKPIVFTSAQAKGSRAAGDWGGIVIMGKGAANRPAATLRPEGGLAGTYGGSNYGGVVDADNSGVLKYVRIEFAGVALSTTANSEINGLTLYAVGKGTTLEYIQVSHCGDDSFEWFGGNVNAKYLIAHRGVDDDFDTDFGYTGNVQFAVALRDATVADQSTSNGFESDNYDPGTVTATDGTPKTAPNFANVSIFLDRSATGLNALHGRGMHLRRNTSTSCYNSVFVGHTEGLRLDGTTTWANANTDNTLKLQGVYLVNNPTALKEAGGVVLNDLNAWFTTPNYKNSIIATLADAKLNTNTFNLTAPNFLPASDSPLLVTTSAATVPSGLTQTDYIGAFKATDWTAGWANFNPQNTDY